LIPNDATVEAPGIETLVAQRNGFDVRFGFKSLDQPGDVLSDARRRPARELRVDADPQRDSNF
jgi:hypothetical protein